MQRQGSRGFEEGVRRLACKPPKSFKAEALNYVGRMITRQWGIRPLRLHDKFANACQYMVIQGTEVRR